MRSVTRLVLFAVGAVAFPAVSAGDENPDFSPKWEYRVLTKNQVLELGKNDLAAGLDKLGAEGWELAAVEPQYIFKRAKGPDRRSEEDLKRVIAVAESDAQAWKDRVAWAERMVKKGYITERQLQSEREQLTRVEGLLDTARKALRDLRPTLKTPGDGERKPEK
jgi:hypothetical protein